MSQGVVTKHLIRLLARQVEDARLVVWYDPKVHYRAIASELDLPEATEGEGQPGLPGFSGRLARAGVSGTSCLRIAGEVAEIGVNSFFPSKK